MGKDHNVIMWNYFRIYNCDPHNVVITDCDGNVFIENCATRTDAIGRQTFLQTVGGPEENNDIFFGPAGPVVDQDGNIFPCENPNAIGLYRRGSMAYETTKGGQGR